MSKKITNHQELIQYLKENDWEQESPYIFNRYKGPEDYKISAFINPFIPRTFEVILFLPHMIERDLIFYKMGRKEEENALEELEQNVNKFNKQMEEWVKHIEEEHNSFEQYEGLLTKYNAIKLEEEGYKVFEFENGKKLYLFELPNNHGFEITIPKDVCEKEFYSKRFDYNAKDIDRFRELLEESSKEIRYLNGWVTPMNKSSYLDSYYGKSFLLEKGRLVQKAIEFRNIMFDILPEEYLFYLFSVIYNDDDREIDFIDLELSKEKPHYQNIIKDLTTALHDLSEAHNSFLVEDNSYRYINLYRININNADKEAFIDFVKDLKTKLEPFIK